MSDSHASTLEDTTPAAELYGPTTYPHKDSRTWEILTGSNCPCGVPATEVAPARLEVGILEPDPRGRHRSGDWIGVCAPHAALVRHAARTLNRLHE